MDKYPGYDAEFNLKNPKRLQTVCFYFYNILEITWL